MRGGHVSKPMDMLLDEASRLADKGVKELIIIGQDTTDYGKDIGGKRNLSELLNSLSNLNGIEWIRLLYAYPSHFPDDVIDTLANNPKVLKYVDMPLQHISDSVLKSMRRGISSRRTKELLYKLKERVPGITLRTTFISGYPAETEKDFIELCDFVKEIEFDRFGVFNYSVEENTPSYILNDPVSTDEKEARRAELMKIQSEISLKKNESFIGKTMNCVIDDIETDFYIARSERDAPEVDGEVLIKADNELLKLGQFYPIEIISCNEYDLFGKLK